MTNFHDKPFHSNSDLVGDPNKPQEGSRKTSFAFVSDIQIEIYRYEFFCGKKGRIPQAAFYKIER